MSDSFDATDAGKVASVAGARSWLFVPGDRPEWFDKAAAADADLVVLDLEDAVQERGKDAAREAVARWLGAGSASGAGGACGAGVVRVNAAGTPHHDADVAALAGAPGLRGVMVAMADSAEALTDAARRTGAPVVALVETADGVLRARELGQAPGVARIAFGAIDLCLDIDAVEEDRTLLFARSTLVLASRAAGLTAPVDGVTTDLSSGDAAGADAAAARRLGFGGKLCIHPQQVGPVTAAFSPSDADVAWARRIVAATDSTAAAGAGSESYGAVAVDGELVDRPVIARARRILDRVPADPEPKTGQEAS